MPIEQATTSTSGLKPRMLHHSGYVTHDAGKTVDFYARILGMDFVTTVMDDRIPSTGEAFPYLHLFFEMGDGSTLAFFESPCMPPPAKATHPAYEIFNHIALAAANREEIDLWADRLRENGIDVVGPVDHGVIYSIYFYDPNGNRLELTTDLDPNWTDHSEQAVVDVKDWEETKRQAQAEGKDVATALTTLIRGKRADMKARGLQLASDLHSD